MKSLLNKISGEVKFSATITGLRGGAKALLAVRTAHALQRPVVVITASEDTAAEMEQDLALFTKLPVLLYPGFDIPAYTPLSPDPATVASRISTLYQLINLNKPFILVIPAEALLRRVIPKDKLSNLAELVITGEETDQADLVRRLISSGYEKVSLVQTPGEISLRGGILDIFPPHPGELILLGKSAPLISENCPVRLDFFGDNIESIRFFDPISQRSLQELTEFTILPVSDSLYPSTENEDSSSASRLLERSHQLDWDPDEFDSLFDHLKAKHRFPGIEFLLPLFHDNPATPLDFAPKNALLILDEPIEISKSIDLAWERITANFQDISANKKPALEPAELFLTEEKLTKQLQEFSIINLNDFPITASPADNCEQRFLTPEASAEIHHIPSGSHTLLRQELELQRHKKGLLTPLVKQIKTWQDEGDTVILACRSSRHAEQLSEFLSHHSLNVVNRQLPVAQEPQTTANNEIILYTSPLSAGFDLTEEKLHFLSESELFGEKRLSKSRSQKVSEGESVTFEELKAGEIVVHVNHGLGSYVGLINMTLNGIEGDYLQINYLDDDKLYVPVDQLNMVQKYKGLSDKEPKRDKLGGKAWSKAKAKVKEAVWKVAQELLDLYAKRQITTGRRFSEPDEIFHELEESFPFDETPGQLKAINNVLDDLTSDRVMDRLVCGDVGYGKTEIAIRAAFKVLADDCQVAILVPTTVLAEQHAATFKERLGGFGVRVETLNRFRPKAEQTKTLKGLKEGAVNIIIGTHRLLSKDIVFHKLGLLIIDEEHRFGVKHKERIKKIRTGVDVLTLTATPIPRTLQMSLLGVRDLSIISSPPRHRRSVKTFVANFDELVIKEAVTREMQRGGQVFVVHNRVQSIHGMARQIQDLKPDARISVAHGQMPGRTLEEIMVKFVNGEIDVLVCTTIVESGLDIPNANTIIITRADRLGLAGIYQLRGRVGRSSTQAYAYLLVPSMERLSGDAQQRLRALMEFNELGGGFKLAMSDLQIRGGGNILGESQSGNIAAVGYDLYLDLLQQTVEDLKRKAAGGEDLADEDLEPEINLLLPAFIPQKYIQDTDLRYITYRKITSCHSEEALADIKEELRDRYGALPDETINLLDVIALKEALVKLKINRLDQGEMNLVFSFTERTPVSPTQLLEIINSSKGAMRLTPDSRLVVTVKSGQAETIIQEAKKILRALLQSAT
ncbi:MAG: transcription-repair coupling factor [Desulfobulbaceae bacterium]|nr:transcription-repair coupling factor [Desulfobulbaceae bacterium]